MTDSSHAHLGIRLPDAGSSSRAGPVPLTCQPANGTHQLATPSSTQIPVQRPTQPSSSSVAPPPHNRGEGTGPNPQPAHITHENARAQAVRQAPQGDVARPRTETDNPRATEHQGTPAEPLHNEAAPAGNIVPIPVPAPIQLLEPARNQLFVDEETLARIRGIAMAKEENSRKVSLPDIIPGFKASTLEIGEHTASRFSPSTQYSQTKGHEL